MGAEASYQRREQAVANGAAWGELFLYNSELGLAAFNYGTGSHSKAIVCLAGLADGLLSLPYLPALAKVASEEFDASVLQPVLSSSFRGWGFSSLAQDARELDILLEYLFSERGVSEVVLLGHGTGCQNVVKYLVDGKHTSAIKAVILESPSSEREKLRMTCKSGSSNAALAEFREQATQMIKEGCGEEIMARAACMLIGARHAITAYRFDSLTTKMADDDMFSSDLTDDQLSIRLGHIHVPTLIVNTLEHESLPSWVDVSHHTERLRKATTADVLEAAQTLVLKHSPSSQSPDVDHQAILDELLEAVRTFWKSLGTARRATWQRDVAKDLMERLVAYPPGTPLMVALAGMPGAGKTTETAVLASFLGPQCCVVQMDGFHTPLARLKEREDAASALYRRGAPDTFDARLFQRAMLEIKRGSSKEVKLPMFDHAAGDPVYDAAKFVRQKHKVVLAEGLYLLHSSHGWEGTPSLFDHRMYLEADIEVCIARVKKRNLCIPGYKPEDIELRTEKVDRNNALLVQRSAVQAHLVVNASDASH